MNKEFAIETQQHALKSVEHLTMILRSPHFQSCSPELQEKLKRNIGELIGETQMGVLEEIYSFFPELDDLK
ncbi:hypothetical protein B0181_06360 [Moraxella caviae]|uniref:Uncharacterized protein n=1 Tax=Moraxella caviae TaxID=34060 RepID=A0A1T0A2R7_9GAMM|nr:hypothetical protein [Moraxella caviae]OOR89591.1 hypothetical protein B0181_06360 [Moraxella caviae]STZ10274.1 Uncharacterised protein [Moraxella caviae]VEW11254.1 Uncharacterised protein [Moraxella caviae]